VDSGQSPAGERTRSPASADLKRSCRCRTVAECTSWYCGRGPSPWLRCDACRSWRGGGGWEAAGASSAGRLSFGVDGMVSALGGAACQTSSLSSPRTPPLMGSAMAVSLVGRMPWEPCVICLAHFDEPLSDDDDNDDDVCLKLAKLHAT